jgi:hypothetical protein
MKETPITVFIKKRSYLLYRWITVLLILVFVLLVSERFSAVLIDMYASPSNPDAWRNLGAQTTMALPETVYLSSLWWVRLALRSFAQGKLFTPVVGRALHRVGITLMTGAMLNIFLVPSLQYLFGEGPGYLIAYDVEGIVLAAVGVSLMLLAHVLRRASELQTEIDEIF